MPGRRATVPATTRPEHRYGLLVRARRTPWRTGHGDGHLPTGFAGGSPELWNVRLDAEAPFTEVFRAAPDRDLLSTILELPSIGPGSSVLELGCGASRHLPHLAQRPGVRVAGVDFSPRGVQLTKDALEGVGADASDIVLGRIEEYVPQHRSAFDVVMSFGLVEHFSDLDDIVRAHVDAARDGGTVLIAAPNLSSVNLVWARLAAPDLFTWHRPISAHDVAIALARTGAKVVAIRHLGGPRLFAQGGGRLSLRLASTNVVRKIVNGVGELLFRASPSLARRLAGRTLSPFFAVIAFAQHPRDA